MSDGSSKQPPATAEENTSQTKTGEHMARALQDYQKARFGPVQTNYLTIFRDRLQNALGSDDAPPLDVAKNEVELFSEQIEKLKSRMFDETIRAMGHWFDLAEKVGARSEIETLLKQSIEQFCQGIGSDALKLAESYADLLKNADAAWRQKYPERVARLTKSSV